MVRTAFFRQAPRYFWIACCVCLAIVAGSVVYTQTQKPGVTPLTTSETVIDNVDRVAAPLTLIAIPPERGTMADVSSAPAKKRDADYWSSIVTEGPYAGMTNAEAQRKINSGFKEMKAELEELLSSYEELEDESARIDDLLARSKSENNAVLADHPTTPLVQRLIKEGYSDEEIARHPEFIRLMTEYLGIDYANTEE